MAGRILVVEDDELLRNAIQLYLSTDLQCEVHTAIDREQAVALVQSYQYAVVIADLCLSPFTLEGLDVVQATKASEYRPRVVVLTGRTEYLVAELAIHRGADAFLAKPVQLQILASTVRELMTVCSRDPGADFLCGDEAEKFFLGNLRSKVQPIFSAENEIRITGVECLTRGPVGTPFENPDALFAYARTKHVEQIFDKQCISLALEAVSGLDRNLRISVNVNASTLANGGDFVRWLTDKANRCEISTSRLTLEIVEHAPVYNRTELHEAISSLRDRQVRIALDDVGLGHSNYKMMIDIRPDYFKLDRYFVKGCTRDEYRRAVIASLFTMSEKFHGEVIAEGVESVEDLYTLMSLGIKSFQGYLISPPIDPIELSTLRIPRILYEAAASGVW